MEIARYTASQGATFGPNHPATVRGMDTGRHVGMGGGSNKQMTAGDGTFKTTRTFPSDIGCVKFPLGVGHLTNLDHPYLFYGRKRRFE